MSQRCNGQVQCPAANDNSDEENCRILDINNEYNKHFNPKFENNPKVPVHVHVFVKNIFGIDELDLSLKMRVQITMEWFDHRLIFRNLRDEQDENIVPQDDVSKLWLPYLIFSDSNSGTRIFNSKNSYLSNLVVPGSNPIRGNFFTNFFRLV